VLDKCRILLEIIQTLSIIILSWLKLSFRSIFYQTPPRKDLRNDIILITGAGSGLGKLLAKRLSLTGATLVLWDVNGETNKETANDIEENSNCKVFSMKVDLCNRAEIYRVAEQVRDQVGSVTMIVNNAGIVSGKTLLDTEDESIIRTFDVNILAHFWVIKAFLGPMLDANYGHIVSIASGAGLFGFSQLTDYCSSKFAAVGLHESLTAEMRHMNKTGIQTTVICPSFINTGMFAGIKTSKSMPLLNDNDVCREIVNAILTNKRFLILPKKSTLLYMIKGMVPDEAVGKLQDFFGVTNCMNTFVGRQCK